MSEERTFGQIIRQARSALGWSHESFAAEMAKMTMENPVAKSAISAWESDAQLPRPQKLRVIAKVLDVPFDELFAAYRRSAETKGKSVNTEAVGRGQALLVQKDDIEALSLIMEAVGPLPVDMVVQLIQARLRKRDM